MGFNTRQTTALTAAAVACNSNALQTAERPGRVQSVFPMGLYTDHSTWTQTATFLSVAGSVARRFIASARAMRSSGAKHQLLTESPPSTWVARSVAVE